MKRNQCSRLALIAILATVFIPVQAKLNAADIARLGADLTPVGAEKAGNKDGSIPAWTGGLVKPPAGFDAAKGYVDPYKDDKPLVTITGANAEQYKDKLAPGQLALLKRYPAYKMVVYPTRRSAGYSDAIYSAIKNEAGEANTNQDGSAVLNVSLSPVPFPIPKSGMEVIINHTLRHHGDTLKRYTAEFPVQTNGSFTAVRRMEEQIWPMGFKPAEPNRLWVLRTVFAAPSNIAGEAILTNGFLDKVKQPVAAWAYNPGTRRVLRAPELVFDTPMPGSDGLYTVDDYDGFNGSPERYNWTLVGKKEMFISYNNYKLADRALKYGEIIKPTVMNQDLPRYELHRVWVVEATLKPGKNHVYGKRVYFIDEDSWQVAHGDLYDGRGELWRVAETHAIQYYDAPCTWDAGNVFYDLQARRYIVSGMQNEEPVIQFNKPMKIVDFTPDALRRLGN